VENNPYYPFYPFGIDNLTGDFDKMGGFGSGGWNASGKPTTSGAKPLDVNSLNKKGALQSGAFSQSSWTRGDEPAGDIQIRAHEGFIKLIYKARTDGGDWQKVDETVPLVWVPCHFGGQRPYFLCPQCERRIVKLYGLIRFFCRTCNNLTYSSQRERYIDRALRTANRLRVRLGGKPGMANCIASRPRYMHHKTYQRITEEIHKAEAIANEFTFALVERLTKRRSSIGAFWA
jgi:hypothetical protein